MTAGNDMRGAPLIAAALVIGAWVVMRLEVAKPPITLAPAKSGPTNALALERGAAEPRYDRQYNPPSPSIAPKIPEQQATRSPASSKRLDLPKVKLAQYAHHNTIPAAFSSRVTSPAAISKISSILLPTFAQDTALPAPLSNMGASFLTIQPGDDAGLLALPDSKHGPNRLSVYSYSFWRSAAGGRTAAAATAAQYGGSQSGLIATYRLTGAKASGLFAMLRSAITPGKFAEQEVAAGLRWQPLNALPVTLTAERRLRRNNEDQFVIYAAVAQGPVPLPEGFSASGYAQAGVIPGRRYDMFFDAGMRADRPILHMAGTDIAAGFGAWTGGQRGAARLDTGPALRGNFTIGAIGVQVSADWRIKVGGNARPNSGPALTISAGF